MSENKPQSEVKVPPALTPEIMAFMNQQTRETIAEMFKALAPTLKDIALTPDKIQAMEDARRAPSETEVARRDREKRERKLQGEDIEEARRAQQAVQDNCPHKYQNGQLSLAIISNRPDRQRLLICLRNHCLITPNMWVVGPPDAENPRGKAYIQKAHPDYARLLREYDTAHQQ